MTTQSIPDCLQNVQIGVNPLVLSHLIKTITLDDKQTKRMHESGLYHLPALAALYNGVLPLKHDTRLNGSGRYHAQHPTCLQSLPGVLRAALTATKKGKTLIYADWKSSHWQILAYGSKDAQMITDIESGDLYDLMRTPWMKSITRKKVKAAACAYLNGAGSRASGAMTRESFAGNSKEAAAFIKKLEDLFTNRWPDAKAFTTKMRDMGVKLALKDKSGKKYTHHRVLGVMLQRIEAEYLVHTLEDFTVQKYCDLLLPMHDGMLFQCDEEDVQDASDALRKAMTAIITVKAKMDDLNGVHVDIEVHGTSWGRQTLEDGTEEYVAVLTGEDLREAAYGGLTAFDDPARLMLAAAKARDALNDEKANHAPASKKSMSIRRALNKVQAAVRYATNIAEKRAREASNLPVLDRVVKADGTPGGIEQSSINLQRALTQDPHYDLWFNDWTQKIHNGDDPLDYGTFVHDTKVYLNRFYQWECRLAHRDFEGAALAIAKRNPRHPLKAWVDGLEWDGKNRMDWLADALYRNLEHDLDTYGISTDDYKLTEVYGRHLVIGMMARLYTPGCKMDEILVLAGAQGVGKQRVWKALCGEENYVGTALAGMDRKDAALVMARAWIYDDQELAGGSVKKEEAKKAFLSDGSDHVRVPYGRTVEKIDRHCVMTGSTNQGETALCDVSGSRRYNIVKVPSLPHLPDHHVDQPVIDVDYVKANREQILAQARDLFKEGEKWWLDRSDEGFQIREKRNRSEHTEGSEWDAPARRVYEANAGGSRNGFTLLQFAMKSDEDLTLDKVTKTKLSHGAKEALKTAGFQRGRNRPLGRYWFKPLPTGEKPNTSDIRTGLHAFHGGRAPNHNGGYGQGKKPDPYNFREAFKDGSNTSRQDNDLYDSFDL